MAKDVYHNAVKEALIQDGWIITHDPYVLRFEGVTYNIDLGAEQILGAEKNGEKIAVEVKSFLGLSVVYEFHEAIGQFLNYLVGLEEREPERILYLAIPHQVYQDFFKFEIIQKTLSRYKISLILFSPVQHQITQWIK